MRDNVVLEGDCLALLATMKEDSVDLVYMDPPFFTQRIHRLSSKANEEYAFDDKWENIEQYLNFIKQRVSECRRVLKKTGSIFVHCDTAASHYIRIVLDQVFGRDSFQNEIIWTYRRWSNTQKGLLGGHQTVF